MLLQPESFQGNCKSKRSGGQVLLQFGHCSLGLLEASITSGVLWQDDTRIVCET